jgi:hypothetical protein
VAGQSGLVARPHHLHWQIQKEGRELTFPKGAQGIPEWGTGKILILRSSTPKVYSAVDEWTIGNVSGQIALTKSNLVTPAHFHGEP